MLIKWLHLAILLKYYSILVLQSLSSLCKYCTVLLQVFIVGCLHQVSSKYVSGSWL